MNPTTTIIQTDSTPVDQPPPDTIVAANRLIEWRTPSYVERVLAVDWANRAIYTILVDGEKKPGKDPAYAFPESQSLADIERALQNGEARLFPLGAPDPYAPAPLIPPIEPTGRSPKKTWKHYSKEKERYDRRAAERDKVWAIIGTAVTERPWDALGEKTRGKLVKEILADSDISKPMVYTYLRRYWQRGQTREAAQLPRNHREKGEVRNLTAKTGAPNGAVGSKAGLSKEEKATPRLKEGVNTGPFREALVRGVEKYYLGQGMTFEKAHEETLKSEPEFWREITLPDGTVRQVRLDLERVPTLRQFRYVAYQERDKDPEAWLKALLRRRYHLNNRPTTGRAADQAFGPGSIWILDSTIGDIYLLSSLRRGRLIGRPIVYLVVDLFSGLIVGFAVTLEGPSYVGAMLALQNATADKVEYCKRYGYDLEAMGVHWPGGWLPAKVQADNSELLTEEAKALVKRLGVSIATTQPWRPDLKGLGERRFRLINDDGVRWFPGYAPPVRDRGDKHYELDATLTLEDFRAQMIPLIIRHNQRRIKRYPRTRFQLEEGVESAPIALWEWGIRRRGALHSRSTGEVILALLPQATGTVTRNGIEVPGLDLIYDCERASKEKWYDTAGDTGGWEVRISYDKRDTSTAWLTGPDGKEAEPCRLTAKAAGLGHAGWEEVADARIIDLQQQLDRRADVQRVANALAEVADSALTQAIAQAEKDKAGMSKAEMTGDVRVTRAQEKAHDARANPLGPTTDQVAAARGDRVGDGTGSPLDTDPVPSPQISNLGRPDESATIAALLERKRNEGGQRSA